MADHLGPVTWARSPVSGHLGLVTWARSHLGPVTPGPGLADQFEMVALAAHVRPTLSTARNDSVAGDEQGNRVPPHGSSHCPRRSGVSRHLCEALVRDRLSGLHMLQKYLQHAAPERISLQGGVVKGGERETRGGLRVAEVRAEPLCAALQLGAHFCRVDRTARGGLAAPFSRCDVHQDLDAHLSQLTLQA
ncbi:hypothetical protein EYF80_045364 [Liparis tanakae]|uniref:Uncharacterized protein n=1 Tax=Liparis tanakae TaxID=230148 RepID=A0A4Z2FU78_9TELE|nr:hypothetical protein EYF80_045364 [Liparis tanakae]